MKELYRAVVQCRPILAVLEPDESQDGGLNQDAITSLITDELLDQHGLRSKWDKWRKEKAILPEAFESNRQAPGAHEVRAALFASPPVEWHRLPQLQDVTIRLIAQYGTARGQELYLEGEAATKQVSVPPPSSGRTSHVFCSPFNAGALEVVTELNVCGILGDQQLLCTSDVEQLDACEHMLVLLDARTWTSGKDTFHLGEHIEAALRSGVHLCCVHEFPSLLGSPRHASAFLLIKDATPPHLCGEDGPANLYNEIAIALLSDEWRKPGLVALATKLASSPADRRPQACDAKMAAWWEAKRLHVVSSPGTAAQVSVTTSTPRATLEDVQRALAQLPPHVHVQQEQVERIFSLLQS